MNTSGKENYAKCMLMLSCIITLVEKNIKPDCKHKGRVPLKNGTTL